MDKLPVKPWRRRWYEAFIRILDLIIYAAVLGGGFIVAFAPPESAINELSGTKYLLVLWATLLIAGGSVGFIGRLVRWWMIEVPATILAFFGALIYFVVLGNRMFASLNAGLATAFVLVGAVVMARRWAELQIFGTEPGKQDFRTFIANIARRRTPNYTYHN